MKIKGKRFLMPEEIDEDLCIEYENGIIKNIFSGQCNGALDLTDYIISAGFIDVHVHGFFGYDISEGTENALFEISKTLTETGVTAFLPTFVSMPFKKLRGIIRELKPKLCKAPGAIPLGFHMEGVFINPEMSGAMNPEYFITPSVDTAKKLLDAGNIKMFTVAPELKNAPELIKFLSGLGITVSLGHTKTDFETAEKAFLNGATSITHFFNAMPHFHHRNTGLIGAGFIYPFYLQFIPDGVHTSKEVLKIIHLFKERLVLITDCTEAGGMPEGKYKLGDYEIFTDKTSARLKSGALAGSILTMDRGVRNLVKYGGFTLSEAVRAATETPAKSINANMLGRIKAGNFANFTVLNRNLRVVMTIIKGKVVFDGRKN